MSFYNHFFVSPIFSTLAILILLPMILVLVFNRSEKVTRNWLGVGFDSDRELLEMITTGTLAETRIGTYLHSLETHFAPRGGGGHVMLPAGVPGAFDQGKGSVADARGRF